MAWQQPKTDWNAADGVTKDDINRIEENIRVLSQQGIPYGVTAGTANAYTVTTTPPLTSLVDGVCFSVRVHVDGGSAPTINPCALGAKAIVKANGVAVGNLKSGGIYTLRFNAAAAGGVGNFVLQGEGGSGNATASDLLLGKTASMDAGDIVGALAPKIANLVPNGSFEYGTSNWINTWTTPSWSIVTSPVKSGGNALKITGTTQDVEACVNSEPIDYVQGHKYYVSCWVYSDTAGKSADIIFPEVSPYPSLNFVCPQANTWYRMAFIVDSPSIVSGKYMLRLDNNNINAATNMYFDCVMVIDITYGFGTGNEPNLTLANAIVDARNVYWESALPVLTYEATAPMTAANLLAGKIGYVNGVKTVGTMPNRSGDTSPYGAAPLGTTIRVVPQTGFYDGVDDTVVLSDADFIAANFPITKNLFGLQGSMPVYGGEEYPGYRRANGVYPANGRLHMYSPPGAYLGVTADGLSPGNAGWFYDDAAFTQANIKQGTSPFGLPGTCNELILSAGDNLYHETDGSGDYKNTQTPATFRTITLGSNVSGYLRLKYYVYISNVYAYAYGQVYRNGSPYGSIHSTVYQGAYGIQVTEDLYFNKGDVIELKGWTSQKGYNVFIGSVQVCVSNPKLFTSFTS